MLDDRPASDVKAQVNACLDQRLKLERTLNLQAREKANREAKDTNKDRYLSTHDLTDPLELDTDRHRSASAVERKGT